MNKSQALIINKNPSALSVTASAARMSTQQGTAMEVFEKSGNYEKDLNLIGKVLSSGHKSVIEHQTLSVAFNDVSVLVEQFIIEFRLASFTVKSRRYVDFSNAGYVIPEGLNEIQQSAFCGRMDRLFASYTRLLELGVPKEDARFLFPYSLRSNFFMTINARELIHMICSMLAGRGAKFAEIRSLGNQLKEQFDSIYPGVIGKELSHYSAPLAEKVFPSVESGSDVCGDASLISQPQDAEALLEAAMAFSGRFEASNGRFFCPENMSLLLNDTRPRELESLNYTFHIRNISLACLTHFTRHRIQSPLIPSVTRALCGGNYVLPESVAAIPEAEHIYRTAFEEQATAARAAQESGMGEEILAYYAMSGHVLDMLLTVNARELLLFAKLRTCTRAQWEIRGVARKMLLCLNEVAPAVFGGYGPSCAVTHRCPEGKMSCGHPIQIINGEWKIKNQRQ